jgi:diacylglycerol O-acyltransferase
MTLDRLSPLDEAFLRIESENTHMHVGWTLLVDGEPPTLDELRAHVEARLATVPRFRRRVLAAPLHLHDPVWVDDECFAIANHVQRVGLPAPGSRGQLRRLVGELLSVGLDRRRPLWRIQLIDGLRDGGFAVVGQVHHALVDGIAAAEVAQLLLDAAPVTNRPGPPTTASRFAPLPAASFGERMLGTAAARAKTARAAAGAAFRVVSDPAVAEEAIATARRIASTIAAVGTPAPRTALNASVGPGRSVAFTGLSLHTAREIGRSQGATINDVVLATVALALGAYLRRGGESPPWLRVAVPVSTRPGGAEAELGNRVSLMFIELPVGERDPVTVLLEVTRQTRSHKRADDAGALDALVRAGALLPTPIRDAVAWLVTRPQTFNLVASNIPGPPEPLYMLGRHVRAAYPAVPLVEGHGLSVGVLSYCGVLHVGLCAASEVVPDISDLGHDISAAFDAIRFALEPRRPRPPETAATPRPGASTRRRRERVLV